MLERHVFYFDYLSTKLSLKKTCIWTTEFPQPSNPIKGNKYEYTLKLNKQNSCTRRNLSSFESPTPPNGNNNNNNRVLEN